MVFSVCDPALLRWLVLNAQAERSEKEQGQTRDRTQMQAALVHANSRISAVESRRAAAEQRANQLLKELEAAKAQAAAAEKEAAECRAQQDRPVPAQQVAISTVLRFSRTPVQFCCAALGRTVCLIEANVHAHSRNQLPPLAAW